MRSSRLQHCLLVAACILSPLLCGAQQSGQEEAASFISFQVPGAATTNALAINDSMVVTGYSSYPVASDVVGFVRSADGLINTFSVSNSSVTIPDAINAAGEIVGQYNNGHAAEGFVRKADGTIITFSPEAGGNAYVAGINAEGTIVGYFYGTNSDGPVHGYVRLADGRIIRFDVPESAQTVPEAINAAGEVTGYYVKAVGSQLRRLCAVL